MKKKRSEKIDKDCQRDKYFEGVPTNPNTQDTPPPKWSHQPAEAHSPGYSLMHQSRLLQKDWGEHYSRPSMASPIPSKLQSLMQCSLER